MDSLASKTLVMIVGPSAVGKSTLMNAVCAMNPQYQRVKSFTTRPPRTNDEPNQYFYLTPDKLDEYLEDGNVITDVVFPTTEVHYGTLTESYAGEYNLLDTLASSVATYRNLPFHRTITVSLTADANTWTSWLLARYPESSGERTKRLEEAKLSIDWSLRQTADHYWLVNQPGDIMTTAQTLIELIGDPSKPGDAKPPQEALALYDAVNNLLSYK